MKRIERIFYICYRNRFVSTVLKNSLKNFSNFSKSSFEYNMKRAKKTTANISPKKQKNEAACEDKSSEEKLDSISCCEKLKETPEMQQNLQFDGYQSPKISHSDGNSNNSAQNDVKKFKNVFFLSCGSFNPITNMHLRMFEIAKDYFHTSFKNATVRTGFISPVCDGYAKKGLESSEHRLEMCSLAIKENPWLQISSWESEQKEWTPTVQVLEHCKTSVCNSMPNSSILLLCGADLLESFTTPGLWKEEDVKTILEEFGVIVVQRPDFDPMKIVYESDLLYSQRKNIHIITDWIKNDISSTKVRRALRRNESIRYLTPDSVVQYIEKHNLYTSTESENKNSNTVLAPYRVNSAKE